MKRLTLFATLLLLLGLTSQGLAAQDASPAAGGTPSTAMLDALGYSALEITYDGSAITMPATLDSGRYLLDFSSLTGAEVQTATLLGATADHPVDEILQALQSADPNQGPPPIYYQVKSINIPGSGRGVVTLTAGDWIMLVVGPNGPAIQQFTVSGDLPAYDPIGDAVQVDLHEMVIDMPDTIAAGDHIWQIENTGAMPHMLSVFNVPGPITSDQVMAALAVDPSAPNATPAVAGDVTDPRNYVPVLDTGALSNGLPELAEVNLEPGTYVAACFFSGPGDVGLHAMMGMYKIFTVE